MIPCNTSDNIQLDKDSPIKNHFRTSQIHWQNLVLAQWRKYPETRIRLLPTILCLYAMLKEIKVSEPFLYKYQSEYLNLTANQITGEVNEPKYKNILNILRSTPSTRILKCCGLCRFFYSPIFYSTSQQC